MRDKDFEKIVKEALEEMPEKIKRYLENVEIVVEKHHKDNDSLLGLYQGVPKTKRGINYANVLPDKITIFKRPIEKLAQSQGEIKKIVKRVLWHEIAHHFGIEEERVKELEKKKFENL